MKKSPTKYFIFIGLLFSSMSSMFIRIIDAPAIKIATYRLIAASFFFMIPFTVNCFRNKSTLSKKGVILAMVSGFFLAGHFATWISSLSYTTVSSSTVLVSLSPLFVASYNVIVLKERVLKIQIIGILVTIIGAVIISAGDFKISGDAIFGDFLAFLGAIFVAGYLIIGRNVRKNMALVDYVFVTYSSSAILLLALSVFLKIDLSFSSATNLTLMITHGLVSSGLGHTIYNWMLQYTTSTFVSTATLGEPVIASVMAYTFLNETPTLQTIIGGIIVIAGLYVFTRNS
ncbi:MAG TPA: EamA family transporter [Clostridiales bacterium]|jgi:drug/metabolite transporter (DMT)-like permease|nr:EamA family transporter [Clostridiales bacterium]